MLEFKNCFFRFLVLRYWFQMQKWIGEPYFNADLHLEPIADLQKFDLGWSSGFQEKTAGYHFTIYYHILRPPQLHAAKFRSVRNLQYVVLKMNSLSLMNGTRFACSKNTFPCPRGDFTNKLLLGSIRKPFGSKIEFHKIRLHVPYVLYCDRQM